jgi:hypothetical protein
MRIALTTGRLAADFFQAFSEAVSTTLSAGVGPFFRISCWLVVLAAIRSFIPTETIEPAA